MISLGSAKASPEQRRVAQSGRKSMHANREIRELSDAELTRVTGGDISIVTDKDYAGIQVTVGGYGFAVWATGGSVCGSVITPKNPTGTPGHCT
jgi:hypothetical protein